VLDTLTRNRPSEPRIYLYVLGVEPNLHGRHFGSAIIDYISEQAVLRDDLKRYARLQYPAARQRRTALGESRASARN
jgi:hypothetical protein